ncbi:MAG: hypothetical protein ACREEM_40865 [Blastocatellia bacterium]
MLTFEQARKIAAREIERLTSEPPLLDYPFGEMWFKREEEPFWVFAAASQKLQDEGYIPGAVYILVDKCDGHLWSDEEQERYYQSFVVGTQPEPVFRAGRYSPSCDLRGVGKPELGA